MTNEVIKQIKKIMKQRGAKHAIYGIVKWNGEKEITDNAHDANFHYTDASFEDEVKYLKNWRGAQMIYAIHAQD